MMATRRVRSEVPTDERRVTDAERLNEVTA